MLELRNLGEYFELFVYRLHSLGLDSADFLEIVNKRIAANRSAENRKMPKTKKESDVSESDSGPEDVSYQLEHECNVNPAEIA